MLRDGSSEMEIRGRAGADDWGDRGVFRGGLRKASRSSGCCCSGTGDESGSAYTDRYEEGGNWRADVGSCMGHDCGAGVATGDAVDAGAAGCATILSAVLRDERSGQAGVLGLLLSGAGGGRGWAEADDAGSAYGARGCGERRGDGESGAQLGFAATDVRGPDAVWVRLRLGCRQEAAAGA